MCHKAIRLIFIAFAGVYSNANFAQCAMCRAAIESDGDSAKAQALNDGIVYLMIIPYVLVAGIGYYIFRLRQKKSA